MANDKLEVLVVSATRAESSLALSPNNISVTDQQQLSATKGEHIQQILSQTPGVSLQRGDGQESLPGIRSAVLTGAGACGSVLVLEEGIPVRGPAFCNVNELFDTHYEQARQVEVTRGPGTAVYGSNALLGSINILLPNNQDRSASLEIGEHSYFRFAGKLGYELESFGAGQLLATITDTDSFRQDSGYQQSKLSWRHNERFGEWDVNIGATFTDLDQETAGFITGLDSYRDKSLAAQNPNPEAFRETRSVRLWSKFSRETDAGYEWSFTPFLRSTDMDFLLHFLPGDPLEENSQTGFGWQSSLKMNVSQDLSWLIGLDADFSEGELRQSQAQPTQGSNFLRATIPTGIHYDYKVDARQLGLFAQAQWQLSDQVLMVAGARYESMSYDYDNLSLTGRTRDDGTTCGFGGCRYSRPADRKDSFTNLSPKLELRYQFDERSTLFASASTAYRAPQATELYRLQRAQLEANLDNVEVENVELGYRYLGAQTQWSMSVYSLNQKNVIIRDSDFFNVDGNRITSEGLELSAKTRLSDSIGLRAAATYAEHKYDSDQFSGGVNINGNLVDTAPKTLLNAALTWRPYASIRAELEWQHVGDYFLEPENLREYPGHNVFNLRVEQSINDDFSVFARILNLSDTRYAERADFTSFTDERYFPGAPRTVFVGFNYRPVN